MFLVSIMYGRISTWGIKLVTPVLFWVWVKCSMIYGNSYLYWDPNLNLEYFQPGTRTRNKSPSSKGLPCIIFSVVPCCFATLVSLMLPNNLKPYFLFRGKKGRHQLKAFSWMEEWKPSAESQGIFECECSSKSQETAVRNTNVHTVYGALCA